MTIRYIYTGRDDISRSPIVVIVENCVYTLSGNDVSIEVPDNTGLFILKEAWVKTRSYRLASDKKQITVMWNTSGSLLLALLQMLLFKSSSFYFKVFIDDEKRIAQWNSRKTSMKTSRFLSLLPIRFFIECGILAVCIWCGSFLGQMISSFLK
ncbi:MAG: hypothetical protein ACTTH7_03740 [Treponema sp.]